MFIARKPNVWDMLLLLVNLLMLSLPESLHA